MTGAVVEVRRLTEFQSTDLDDLVQATEAAIDAGGGFGWIRKPRRHLLESFWKGVLLVPDRYLLVGRVDGAIAGAIHLVRPARNAEAHAHQAIVTGLFVAPWARGLGLAKQLMLAIEQIARECGTAVLNLDVRETQVAAIALFETLGYRRWGTHPAYATVDGRLIGGFYYWKSLDAPPQARAPGRRATIQDTAGKS